MRYMYEAGYDPAGMAGGMFRELLRRQERQPGAVAQFFSTHPLTSDRITAVERYARQLPDRSGLTMRDGRFPSVQERASRF